MNTPLKCDCLNDCGDDPRIKKGLVAPCKRYVEAEKIACSSCGLTVEQSQHLAARANTPDSAAQGAMGDESACNRYKDSERAACVEAIRFTRQDVKYIWAAFIKYADCVDDPRKVIHDKAKALILCSSTEASDAGRQG